MRKTLVAAVALAPICLILGPPPAYATDDVTTGLTAPIATATATNNAPDDIDIDAGGSVTVTGMTPAITQNSPNSVAIAGAVNIKDVSNSTGVLIQSGTSFASAGTITNTETFAATDTLNKDGVVEGPFASGSGRYGIHAVGGAGLTGGFANAGTISIQGNDSYGVLLETPIATSDSNGLANSGTITILGDHSVGLKTTTPATIHGDVLLSGAITSTGTGSSAVDLEGAVTGSVRVYSSITSTGYSIVTRPTTSGELTNLQATPADLGQTGAAVTIDGNVANGIFIGAPPVGTLTTSTADADGDGVEDSLAASGAINVYGSAPALLIGGVNAVTIGPFSNNGLANTENVPQTPPANDYDLIVRGSINASGVFDGATATAVQIGGQADAQGHMGSVVMAEGVRVVGSINVASYDADATAIHIGSGATVGSIRNEGFIDTTVNHSLLDLTGDSKTPATAYGILVDANVAMPSIVNYGYLTAAATSDNDSAVAIKDRSTGVLPNGASAPVTITNEGVISSTVTPGVFGDAVRGQAVALDLSDNQTGVTLLQQANPNPIAIDVETTTSASGTTTTTAATTGTVSGSTVSTSTSTTTSSTVTATVTTTAAGVTTTTTSTTPTTPAIVGDVLLGSGTNTVQLLGGTMTGALDLGSGATGENSSFTIDHGAFYYGAFTYGGTGLALNVANGTLENTSATTLHLASLNVGSTGVLYAAIDPQKGVSTLYQVNGAATLAAGAQLGITLNSPLTGTATYTIVQAASLTNANTDTTVLSSIPYLLNATAVTDTAAGTINLTVSGKTAGQLGLNGGQAAALNPILASLGNDAAIEGELLGQYTQAGFLSVYNQLLPDYSGGVFQMASAASDAITRATSRTNEIENPSGTRGAWAQEFAFGVDRSASGATGYRGDGFGFVGGLETGGAGLGAFGLTGSFIAGTLDDPHSPGDNQQAISEGELGGYWQGQFGGFRADARVGGGYVYFADRRELLETSSTGSVLLDRNAKGSGRGWSGTGHFGAAYQFDFGHWYVRPNAQGDFFELYEGSFNEHGGAGVGTGDGFDLALASRTGRQASGLAALTVGRSIGTGFVWRPELQVGYRDVFSGTAGDTTAQFSGGDKFTLSPVPITGGGPVARLGVKADTDFYELDFQAGAEERNKFTEADVRLNVRVLF